MLRTSTYYCFLLIVLFVATANAQSPVHFTDITTVNDVINISSGIEFLKDAGHNVTPDSAFKSKDFKKLPDGVPNKNYTSAAYWF